MYLGFKSYDEVPDEFLNLLNDVHKTVFKLKIEELKNKEIANKINRTYNYVAGSAHQIKCKYEKFVGLADIEKIREKNREYNRKYREKHSEHYKEYYRNYSREYRQKNLEKIREYKRNYAKEYRKKNPEKVREYDRRKYYKKRQKEGRAVTEPKPKKPQYEKILAMREKGFKQVEIARALGCSRQNISSILKHIDAKQAKKVKSES